MRLLIGGAARRSALAALALVVLSMLPFPVLAQLQGGGIVREIRIEGTQRIEPETVRSYLLVQPGESFDDERVDRSLKELFATGLFADVTLRREGDTLIIHVIENPIINRIAFEGNHKYDDKALNDELQLKPRIVYTRTRVQADVKRILDLYRRSGRYAATVDPKVIPLDQNRVDLVFEINEGPVTKIDSINFIGNHEFGRGRLQSILQTKESHWYRFLSSSDNYDPDRITYDRELLRKFYLSQGYADFRVVSAVAELNPERDAFYVTFTLEEGARYRLGKVAIDSQIKDISGDDLLPLLTTSADDWYNADQVDKSVDRLTEALGNRGFAFVEIKPRVERNREAHTVDLTYVIQEGPRVYVERIDITGNTRTLDKVIRREFRLVEGDAFNTSKLRRSKERIKNLDFFKKVEVNNTPGSTPDRTIVTVEVEEQSTGELSLGGGFSSTDGPIGDVSIRERNLLGRGQDMRVGFTISGRTQQIDLSFTEPYFLERNIAAGIDIFEVKQQNQLNATYDQQSYGTAFRGGYQLTEYLRQTLHYTIRSDEITNVQSFASNFIRDQQGRRITSSVGQALLWDKRDNLQEPTGGYYLSLGTDFAGLGGQVHYIRNKLGAGWYYSIADGWVLGVTGEFGSIAGIGEGVRIQDRWFIGGDNLRGFATAGIGPRVKDTEEAIGGNTYYVGSLQLGIPLGLPEEFGLTGRLFADFGDLWSFDTTGSETRDQVNDVNGIRVATGFGVSWKSPFGPIRVDLGVPVIKQKFDKTEFFHISFGSRF